jgi:hypothetical protein
MGQDPLAEHFAEIFKGRARAEIRAAEHVAWLLLLMVECIRLPLSLGR